MDCMVRPASSCSSCWRIEPVHLKTFPQRHPRSMQHYPKIAVADGEDRANLFAGHSIHFAHREYGTNSFRQFREAIAHDLPELGTMHHLIRLGFPFMRSEVMIPKADRYELLRKLIRQKCRRTMFLGQASKAHSEATLICMEVTLKTPRNVGSRPGSIRPALRSNASESATQPALKNQPKA